jgi:Protein of unknown function (DUF4058)
MNPYLEQTDAWHDFHHSYITEIRAAIAPQIRPNYLAKIDENVYIHELSAEQRLLLGRPDVAVLRSNAPAGTSTDVANREAPVYGQVSPATDIVREPFIEIRDTESRQLVTVIELLGPTNKSISADRDQYIAKRRKILAGGVHLVEIDLLRGGPRMPVEKMPQCDYIVMVSRSQERPRVGLWPVRLKERLPEIPIPLRHADADALVDLQSLLDSAYDAAGYADYVYGGTPSPPLHPEDAKWAEGVIAAQSRAT